MKIRALRVARDVAAIVVAMLAAPLVTTFFSDSRPLAAAGPPGISLSPAVVMLKGQPGQGHRQTLRLTNHTSIELAFELTAQDVVADEGRRVFLAAGERSDSIAATAVFSPKEVVIPAGEVGTAHVTLTVPPQTAVRAVAAIFRGRTAIGARSGVAMTASLGCLITFTLSDDLRLGTSEPQVAEQTATTNLTVGQWVTNVGSEPVYPSGAVALLNETGTLVSRMPIEPQRLLPGERLMFGADYPTVVAPGRYRAVLSLEYEQKVLTSAVDFTVPSAPGQQRPSRGSADVRR